MSITRVHKFRWVVEGILAGSARVFSKEEMDWLYKEGIRAVVCLKEVPLYQEEFEKRFEYKHIPIDDYRAPSDQQMLEYVKWVEQARTEGKPVLTFCDAGLGRTSCMLAVYLVYKGLSPEEAMKEMKKSEPNCLAIPEQVEAICRFHQIRQD